MPRQFLVSVPVLVATCLLMLGAGAAQARVECGAKPIRLGFYEYGYFYFDKEKDRGRGIDKDVVDELARRTGCQFDTQVMARARIWADLASGDLDMSVSGIRNAERDKFASFANYLTMKNYALVQQADAASVRRADDFMANRALQFGVVRAFKHGEKQDQWLDRLHQEKRVQESPDVATLFLKLKDRRVAAMFSQPPVYRKNMADLGMQNDVVVQDWTPGEKGVPHGLILAKSRFGEADVAAWQQLIEAMRSDGTLKRIFSRYLPADEAGRMLDF